MTGRHPVRRVVGGWVLKLYDDRRPTIRCEAFGGPCDGRTWSLSVRPAPIWLSAGDGRRHLYVPGRGRGTAVVRYLYEASSADVVGPPRRSPAPICQRPRRL